MKSTQIVAIVGFLGALLGFVFWTVGYSGALMAMLGCLGLSLVYFIHDYPALVREEGGEPEADSQWHATHGHAAAHHGPSHH